MSTRVLDSTATGAGQSSSKVVSYSLGASPGMAEDANMESTWGSQGGLKNYVDSWMAGIWRLGAGVEQGGTMPVRQQLLWMDPYALPYPSCWLSGGAGGNHPYVEASAPLGIHLHPSTKEKIWKGEYIDLCSGSQNPSPGQVVGCPSENCNNSSKGG